MRSIILAIQLAFRNLRENIVRTFVTLTGIVISIAAIILVMSAGGSVKSYVLSQVESFGSDVIQTEVRVPSGTKGQDVSLNGLAGIGSVTTMKMKDGERIGKLDNVEAWYATIIGQALVQQGNTRKQTILWGASPGVTIVDPQVKVAEGVFYSESDEEGAARKVVLGSGVKDTLFGNRLAVGKTVRIKGQSYTVSGVLAPRGSSFGLNFDDLMYVPIKTMQNDILGIKHIEAITTKVKDVSKIEQTADQIRRILRDRHDISDPNYDDFQVVSIQEAQDTVAKVFGAINILLLAVASISLLVGGVGIMNVMFVALEERTQEIGLRKALGARSGDILKQFLLEASTIAFVGGAVGIVIGTALLFAGLQAAAHFGFELTTGISFETLAIAVGFSIGVGILFGVYPAWRAAKVPPVVAMRQE